MDSCTFDTYARANRIDAVIEALHSYLGTLTRDAGDVLDANQAVMHLGYLLLEQTLQEQRAGTTEDDLRILVLVINLYNHGANSVALAIEVRRDLVLLGQVELVVLLVKQQHLFLPNLIELAGNDLAELLAVTHIQVFLLQVKDLRCQRLTQVQDHTAAKHAEIHAVGNLLTHLSFVIELKGVGESNLGILVSHIVIFHDETVTIHLEVTLVGVDDHVVVCVRSVHLSDHTAERFLQHIDQRLLVNVLELLEVLENFNQID